jgi:hypothetical protein
VRLINEVAKEPLTLDGVSASGVVRRRGVASDGDGARRWRVERRTPLAFVVDSGDGSRRFEIPQQSFNPLPLLAPVVGYLIVRMLLRRRSRA